MLDKSASESGGAAGAASSTTAPALSARRPLKKILSSARNTIGKIRTSLSTVTQAQMVEHGQRVDEVRKQKEDLRKMNQHIYAKPAELELADAFIARGRFEDAQRLLNDALDIQHARFGDATVPVAYTHLERAKLSIEMGEAAEAIEIVKRCVLNVVATAKSRTDAIIDLDVAATEVIAKGLISQGLFVAARELCEDSLTRLDAGSPHRLQLQNVIDFGADKEREHRTEVERRRERRANPYKNLNAESVPLELFKEFLFSEDHFCAIAQAASVGRTHDQQTNYTHTAYMHFKQLLESEKNGSFLSFWHHVEDFKNTFIPRSKKSRDLLRHIMDKYIRSQRLDFLTKHMKDEIEALLSDPKASIFDDAQAVALHNMYFGSFKRFIATEPGNVYIKLHALDNPIFESAFLNISRIWRGYAARKVVRKRNSIASAARR